MLLSNAKLMHLELPIYKRNKSLYSFLFLTLVIYVLLRVHYYRQAYRENQNLCLVLRFNILSTYIRNQITIVVIFKAEEFFVCLHIFPAVYLFIQLFL